MLVIKKTYLRHTDGQARLCADISLNGRGTTLWFGVDEAQEDYLCTERSDAFVMALLPTAMRGGYEIICQTQMSERLHYQLENYLIPTLCSAGDVYRPVKITAPLTAERLPGKGGVGTGFSGGVDSLYTIMTHGKDSTYPLTHLTLFNVGVFEGPAYTEAFRKSCRNAQPFADEMGLELVCLDSNISKVLPERYLSVCTYRLLAGALALQGLFSVYLLSSAVDIGRFMIDLHIAETHEYLNISCAQTETLSVYNAGAQLKRTEKIRAISGWEPAHRWLHFCIYGHVGEKNCGHCKKCARDISTLYSFGVLDRFGRVIDIPTIQRTLPRQLGLVFANRDACLFDEAAQLLENSGANIPPAAYVYADHFRKGMENLKETQR